MIHLLFTGGTISMQYDANAGGNVPRHGGDALVALAPELGRIAPYRVDDWAKMPACHMGPDRLWALRERVRTVVEQGDVAGLVVTHGTDVIEETAYLLARTLDIQVPVAITGAMLTAGETGWDGARNLTDAVRVASAPASRGRGAMVVFAGKVFAGIEAVKINTVALEAFGAPHGAPLGRVGEQGVAYERAAARRTIQPKNGLTARVALVPMVVGDDGTLLDLARPTHDGVVLIGFGAGNIPPGAVAAVGRWIEEGKPVVISSRCDFGEVVPAYAFDGGGARLAAMGVIPAGPRTPWQARMELTIALSAGVAYG